MCGIVRIRWLILFFKCNWIERRRRRRRKRKKIKITTKKMKRERKIKIKNRSAQYRCPWAMFVLAFVAIQSQWQCSQYKFKMNSIDTFARPKKLSVEQKLENLIQRRMRTGDDQVNTCQTFKWLSDQFALTNRIWLCFPKIFFSFHLCTLQFEHFYTVNNNYKRNCAGGQCRFSEYMWKSLL